VTDRQLRWLLAAYPRAWRERYGEEFEELAEDMWSSGETTHTRLVLDLLGGACTARGRGIRVWFRRSLALPLGAAVLVGVALVALTTSGPAPTQDHVVAFTAGGVPSFGGSFGLRTFPERVAVEGEASPAGFVLSGSVLGSWTLGQSGSVPGPGNGVPVFAVTASEPVGHVLPIQGFSGSSTGGSSGCSGSDGVAGAPGCAVQLPDLVGLKTPTAAATLSELHVAVDVENITCTTAGSGLVGAMVPAAGSTVGPGAVVTIDNCT
jgi:hypothetical protein